MSVAIARNSMPARLAVTSSERQKSTAFASQGIVPPIMARPLDGGNQAGSHGVMRVSVTWNAGMDIFAYPQARCW